MVSLADEPEHGLRCRTVKAIDLGVDGEGVTLPILSECRVFRWGGGIGANSVPTNVENKPTASQTIKSGNLGGTLGKYSHIILLPGRKLK